MFGSREFNRSGGRSIDNIEANVFEGSAKMANQEKDKEKAFKDMQEINRYLDENAERKEKYTEMEEKAIHDQLTGLFNRHYVMKKVPDLIKRAQYKENGKLVGIYFDLDNFKRINDEHSHGDGDLVLKTTGETLKSLFKPTDIVARLGGEEFMAILPNVKNEKEGNEVKTANQIALERAKEAVEAIRGLSFNFGPDDPDHKITASVGVYTLREGDNIEDFIDNADKAMFVSKKTGKDRITEYDDTTDKLFNELNKENKK